MQKEQKAETKNYWFHIIILFSDFIQPDAEHILGTQCDQKILSKKESSGVVFSPNYPLPYQVTVGCF